MQLGSSYDTFRYSFRVARFLLSMFNANAFNSFNTTVERKNSDGAENVESSFVSFRDTPARDYFL